MNEQEIMATAKQAYEKLITDGCKAIRAEIYSDTLRLSVGYDIDVQEAMCQSVRRAQTSGRFTYMPAGADPEDLGKVAGEIMLMLQAYFSQKNEAVGAGGSGGY